MSEKSLYRTLIVFTIINCIYMFLNIFLSSNAMADDLEHIHAAWLVWNGQLPYVDFFEHHHPLMWYLFAPIVGLFERNMLIFFVVRFFVVCISGATIYCVYRIVKDFIADKLSALLAVNIFCFSTTALDAMVQFKPDAFMQFCFFAGVYFFLRFLQNKKQRDLNVAGVLFTCGFLFLQTISFLMLPLIAFALYCLYSKQINLKNVAIASIAPLIICLISTGLLCYFGMWQRYFELNWVVNSKIMTSRAENAVIDFSELYGVLFLGFIAAIYLAWQKKSQIIWLFIALWASEFLLRACYVSVGMYYFKILLLYNAILIGCAAIDIYRKWDMLAIVICFAGVMLVGKFWLFEQVGEINALTMVGVATDISKNSTADDVVLGTTIMPLGVFNRNPHYYWFSWDYIGKIDEQLFHYAEPFDINRIIAQEKPKFVYFEDDLRENYQPSGPYDVLPPLLKVFYKQAKYNTLYQLK